MLCCLPSPPDLFLSPVFHPQEFAYVASRDFPSAGIFFFHINPSSEISNSLLSMMWGVPGSGRVGKRAGVWHKTLHMISTALSRGNVPCEQTPQPRGSLIIVKRDYSFLSSSCHCPRVHTHVHTRKHTHALMQHCPYVISFWKLVCSSPSLP